MKVILGTSNVPTTIVFIILFVTLGIPLLTIPLPQYIYAQTVEDEIIENTLESIEEATPNSLEITKPFQLENITTNLSNESAITSGGQTTEEPVVGIEANVTEGTESALAGPGQISKEEAIKSASNDSDLSSENQYGGGSTLEEQLKLAQEKLFNQLGVGAFNISKLDIDLGFPSIDFSNILENSGSLVSVEYQSASSVVLRGDEETLLLVNGTLAPFWYAIDIVTNHGYQLKEITESGMGSQGNPTRFYAILEKDEKTPQITTTTINNNTGNEKKETANETILLVQNNTNNKDSLDNTSRLDQKQKQQQQPSKENTKTTLTDTLPKSNNTIKILSHDSYIDSGGTMHVVGEVENNTPKVAQFVEIIGTFYDSNNKVVGTSSTFTSPTDLASGEITPFDLMLSDASIPIEQIERYTLKVSGQ